MVRVSKVDSCLICGQTPCACGKRGKPTLPALPEPVEKPAIKLVIPRLRPKVTSQPKVKPTNTTLVSEEDLVLIAALRNVEPIMSDESRERFKAQLMTPETHEERSAFWKARRDETRQSTQTSHDQ